MSLCECGCGREVKDRFVSGHNKAFAQKHHTEGSKKQMSENRKKKFANGELIVWNKGKEGLQVAWNKGLTKETDKRVRKISESKKKSSTGKIISFISLCECGCGLPVKRRFLLGHWAKTKEGREKIRLIGLRASGRPKGSTPWWVQERVENPAKNPVVRQKMMVPRPSIQGNKNPAKRPEVRRKISKVRTEEWKDPEYAKKVMKNVRPNKKELILNSLLQKILPNEYRYVGNGEFVLGGKIPDFLNVNGKKKLIELYGDYWHKGDNPQKRIDFFRKYGFDCLVIWESELKNMKSLPSKILQFNEDTKKGRW